MLARGRFAGASLALLAQASLTSRAATALRFRTRMGAALSHSKTDYGGAAAAAAAMSAVNAYAEVIGLPDPNAACADVELIPFASDNYAYYLRCRSTGAAALVDPADPDAALRFLQDTGEAAPQAVLCTHKHGDHQGGNVPIRKFFEKEGGDVDVVSTSYEPIDGVTLAMKNGEQYTLGGLTVTALHTPCHTRGHVCFLVTDAARPDAAPVLFAGDTLFVGGCGRFFEGNAQEMYGNLGLEGVLATLPPETQVFCGHEYTASNLRFALSVDGANPNLQAKAAWVDGMRAEGRSTIPTTIGGERLWNPFMRADQPELKASVGLGESADPIEVMAAVRAAKDRF
eukprot:CAMPEP_0118858388 /NCGR_PEP_ID=MMETSP1163-20130328/5087_1 /TAXON_ID=124430 /ORGANISM="Phaeomonas parva, Strain CCMP2877" /LENGTH=341 /DNA_ID=CAMNT_0006791839 /DNA_START=176 /DNA_END=1201 /DNA_ORIENTATION=+